MSDHGWTYKLPFAEILRRKESGPKSLQTQLAAAIAKADLPAGLRGDDPKGTSIETALHPADDMFVPGDADHYLAVGLSALRGIRSAMQRVGAAAPQSILDMPCGFGRVTRVLRGAFGDAMIHACDIQSEAIEFCADRFGCRPFESSKNFDDIPRETSFDLIWCGSLLTHLSGERSIKALRFFRDCLRSNGVCVVSVHGEFPAQRIRGGESTYGLDQEGQRKVLIEFDQTGFGYSNYPEHEHYGTSLTKEVWLDETLRELGCRMISFEPRGFDNHQDLCAFSRESGAAS